MQTKKIIFLVAILVAQLSGNTAYAQTQDGIRDVTITPKYIGTPDSGIQEVSPTCHNQLDACHHSCRNDLGNEQKFDTCYHNCATNWATCVKAAS